MDGSPRREVFSGEFWDEHQPEFADIALPGTEEGEKDDDHDEEIMDRLKSLGYLA
jgi:hypothetical protein